MNGPDDVADAVLTRIGEAIALAHRGERQQARAVFAAVWDEIGGDEADPLHRCALAHPMADVRVAQLPNFSAYLSDRPEEQWIRWTRTRQRVRTGGAA